MRTLGIDPGLRITGYGVVEIRAGSIEPHLVEGGIIKLDAKQSVGDRLVQLAADLNSIIAQTRPDRVAVEKLYAHYAHPRTAIIMGHARGTILLTARQHGIELVELAATEVKKAVTGNGHASKEQMQRSIQSQFRLAEPPSPPDVADAIAIAACCARRNALEQLDPR